jgi:hypothetical protein
MTRPVETQTRDDIIRLAGEGKGRNAIARELGIGAGTVTRYANEAGIEFDRSHTEFAIRAAKLDLSVASIELAKQMVERAFESLALYDAPTTITHFESSKFVESTDDGKTESVFVEGGWREHVLDTPTIGDQQRIMTTAAVAFDKARKIVDTSGSDREKSAGLLDTFGKVLERAAEEYLAGDSPQTEYPQDDTEQGEPDGLHAR